METPNDHINRDLEAAVLATAMDDPRQIPLLVQYLGCQWPRTMVADPAHRVIADVMDTLYNRGQLPDRAAVRRQLELGQANDAVEALGAVCRHLEHPDFLEQRIRELLETTQMRLALEMADEIRGLASRGIQDMEQFTELLQARAAGVASKQIRAVSAAEAAERNWQNFLFQRANPGALLGVPTGFAPIDAALCGLQWGKPYVLGARPSHGKTAIACNVVRHAAIQGIPSIIFAHEMSAEDYTLRIAAELALVDYNHIHRGRLNLETTQRFMEAIEQVKTFPIDIIDQTIITPRQCQAFAQSFRHSRGQGLLVVDHLQLERIPNHKGSRADELALISQTWLETVKITGHASLLLSQLNRDGAGRPPRLSDLRESGAIEQDAHGAMLLYRPGIDDDEKTANQGQLMLAKNRNGPLAAARLHFTGFCMRFRDWDRDHDTELTREQQDRAEGELSRQQLP